MSTKAIAKPYRKHVYQGDPLAAPPPADLAVILDRHRGERDALITVLEEIQAHYGYLPQSALQYTARELGFPLSRVYGVATFYNLFQFSAPGRYIVRVCKGTACHVNRSGEILKHLKERLGIGEDETTPDGLFTLQTVACMGACSLAPVLVVNDVTYGNMTPEKAWEALAEIRGEASEGAAKEEIR
jgi:NADH:ubiquinone oxidoreductase subunit E